MFLFSRLRLFLIERDQVSQLELLELEPATGMSHMSHPATGHAIILIDDWNNGQESSLKMFPSFSTSRWKEYEPRLPDQPASQSTEFQEMFSDCFRISPGLFQDYRLGLLLLLLRGKARGRWEGSFLPA